MQVTPDKIYDLLIQYGLKVAAAILIFFIGKWVGRSTSHVVGKVMHKSKVPPTLLSFTKHLVYFAILTFAALAALSKLGVETTSFIAIIGAAGLAVGLALQGSLANFASGVMIVIFAPFEVGDFIEAGGAAGTVQEIQIFSTIMIAPDKKKIIVPNAKITGDKIVIHLKQ